MSPEADDDGGERFTADFLGVAAKILKPILLGMLMSVQDASKRLLSHYKIDVKRNRLLIMSCNAEDMLLPRSNFTFYEFDSNFKLLQSQEFNIPDHMMIHDWAFTDSHYILFGNRIKLDVAGSMTAVFGLSPMISALSLNPSKSTSPIYLLPRCPNAQPNRLARDWRVPIEAPSQMWVLHVANAFEEKNLNGNLHIQIQASSCSYHWFNFQKMFGYDWQSGRLDPSMMNLEQGQEKLLPHLVQVNISLDAKGNCQECRVNDLNQWNRPSDFPVINQDFSGTKNTYVYAASSSGSRQALPHFPFDTVVKLDTVDKSTHTWSTGRRRFIGEPIYIPKGSKGEEDDGYLLVVEYAVSTQRCYLVILDPKLMGRKNALVARFEVPRHLNFPLGFHGFWAPHTQVSRPIAQEFALSASAP
ncbi:Carotenoid cleavage dioxygenase 7, chloroplastic [Sesamum angolense]|uniref:Carotenoid cleavage dioxygenase 7, chloroplastic n=1 Tax=Sesamum angolense TaxID=2727404 RepID=A0AAE1XGX8_9LAMI|nr:Carotenoid cleavage dioxygenase 7, chloroplastic [Sesamum angolense]